MSVKKLKEISSEALLNALNDEKLEVESSPVYDFIERFGLKSGKFKVPARLLYNIFLKYYPQTLLYEYFNNEASLLLKYNKRRSHYHLNKESKLLHYEANKPLEPTKNTLPNSFGIQKHFNTFLAKLNITKGDQGVPWFVLYDVYRGYCIDIKYKSARTFRTFNNFMRFHFEFINNDYGPVFLVNINPEFLPNKENYGKLKEKYKIDNKKKSL